VPQGGDLALRGHGMAARHLPNNDRLLPCKLTSVLALLFFILLSASHRSHSGPAIRRHLTQLFFAPASTLVYPKTPFSVFVLMYDPACLTTPQASGPVHSVV
jgi:hypothetical protein